MNYVIILEPGPNNWGAFSPNVPGCVSTGQTAEETLSNFLEALEFHLEGLQEDGDPIPAEYSFSQEDFDAYNDEGAFFRWAPVDTTPRNQRANPPLPPLSPAAVDTESVPAD